MLIMIEILQKEKTLKITVLFISLSAFLFSVILRLPTLSENFLNSDASYHVLLTMNAFRYFAFQDHFYLPIVTINQNSTYIS